MKWGTAGILGKNQQVKENASYFLWFTTTLPQSVCDLHTALLYETIHIRFHFLLHGLLWIQF